MSSLEGVCGFKSGFLQKSRNPDNQSKKTETAAEKVLHNQEQLLAISGSSSSISENLKNVSELTSLVTKVNQSEGFLKKYNDFFISEDLEIIYEMSNRWSSSSNLSFLDLLAHDIFSEWKQFDNSNDSNLKIFAAAYRTLHTLLEQLRPDLDRIEAIDYITDPDLKSELARELLLDMSSIYKKDMHNNVIHNRLSSFRKEMPKKMHPKLDLLLKIISDRLKCRTFAEYPFSKIREELNKEKDFTLDKKPLKSEDIHSLFAFYSYCDPFFKTLEQTEEPKLRITKSFLSGIF